MNFNITHKNEYTLNNSMICECINLYGVEVKLIKTEKINYDKDVFGDWSHVKTNNTDIFDITILPESPETVENQDYMFGDFGFANSDTASVFVSAQSCFKLGFDINNLMSCLIVFPSNKVMEITNVELQSTSVNNLWAYSDAKSVLRFSLSAYSFKSTDETNDLMFTQDIDDIGIGSLQEIEEEAIVKDQNYDALDGYFETLFNEKNNQDYEAEVKPSAQSVKINGIEKGIDEVINKPVVDKDETDVFGW